MRMRRRAWSCLCLSVLLGSAPHARAADEPLPPPEGLAERIQEGRLRLGVVDAVRLTLLNDSSVRVSQIQQQIQEHAVDRALSPFDPTLGTSMTSSHSTMTAITQLAGAPTLTTQDRRGQIALRRTFSTGTALNLNLDAGRSQTNSSFASINPSFSSGLSFGLSQPLLRGFGTFTHRAP